MKRNWNQFLDHPFFFPQLTFSDVCNRHFRKLFHTTWLYSKKKRCYADFLKVPPIKNDGRKLPKFRPILRLIATYKYAVTHNVKEKKIRKQYRSSVIISLYVHQIW